MMTDEQCRQIARNLCVRGIRGYKQRFLQEEDIVDDRDKAAILAEMENVIEEIKEDRANVYKRRCEDVERRLVHISSLDDCDEEFEI